MYIKPEYDKKNFTCLFCGGNNQHEWSYRRIKRGEISNYYSTKEINEISVAKCTICEEISIWYLGKLLYPMISNIPNPNEDMPEKIKNIYNEAKNVYFISKKSSAALMRLALQHLCKELGEKGENINTDIGNLVKKGLNSEIQKMMDVIRVFGNNAVHPGEINLDEDEESVEMLFNIMNLIIDEFYTKPKNIKESYEKIPEHLRKAIEKRDSKNSESK